MTTRMTRIRLRAAVAAAVLSLAAPPALHAQPLPKADEAAPVRDDAHILAGQFLDKIGADAMMQQLLGSTRSTVVVILQQHGQTEEAAGQVFDQYMLPEFRRRLPELRAKFEDILAADFTVPELQAIVHDEQNDARRSAAAKAGQLSGQFSQAGQEWGQRVGQDVYAANKEALDKLGLGNPGGTAQ